MTNDEYTKKARRIALLAVRHEYVEHDCAGGSGQNCPLTKVTDTALDLYGHWREALGAARLADMCAGIDPVMDGVVRDSQTLLDALKREIDAVTA